MVQVGKKRAIKFWKYYKEWYETYKYGDVRDVTYQRYILTGKQIKELAPDLMLDKITRADIQKLINTYGQTHEKTTVRDFYRLLEAPIRDAVYEGWISRDPCYKIRITSQVKKKKKLKKWLEMDEVHKLEQVFNADQSGYGDFFDFTLRTGLRFAEVLGLTPADVDMNNMSIYVNKTLNYKKIDYSQVKPGDFMPTKNKYSVRQIPIDFKALTDLQRHLDGVNEDESIWAHWYASDSRTNTRGGNHVYNSVFNNELKKMCEQAGVPQISVHGLRHTHASLLIANRVSIQSVAKRLGHGDTETTQRVYIHLLDKLANEDNNKIMSVMTGI